MLTHSSSNVALFRCRRSFLICCWGFPFSPVSLFVMSCCNFLVNFFEFSNSTGVNSVKTFPYLKVSVVTTTVLSLFFVYLMTTSYCWYEGNFSNVVLTCSSVWEHEEISSPVCNFVVLFTDVFGYLTSFLFTSVESSSLAWISSGSSLVQDVAVFCNVWCVELIYVMF